MANGVILYQSRYGSTKRYAEWLAEETGFDCLPVKDAKLDAVRGYEQIVLAGGIYASGIAGLSFFGKYAAQLAGKRLAVFCVGASPDDAEAFQALYAHNFKGNLDGIPCFYGRGAWDEEAMSFADRTLCRLLQKSVGKKDPATYEPWQKALMCAAGQKCDWTDRACLRPLLDWLAQ